MITSVTIQGFLPFRDEPVTLPFANQGLVLVRGDNRVSQACSDNGSGKTTVGGHALSWGWFGEDLLGRRADAVANRFTDGVCLVRIDHDDALGKWSVERTRRPAALRAYGIPGVGLAEDAKVVQAKIEQRLGFGLRTFRNAVVFGQGAFDRFSSADQAEQMRMLDEIQGVDFREARERAKAWRDWLEQQRGDFQAQENRLSVAIVGEQNAIAELERIREAFGQDIAVRVARLEAMRPVLEKTVLACIGERQATDGRIFAKKRLRAAVLDFDHMCVDLRRLSAALLWAGAESTDAKDKLNDLQTRLHDLTGQGACPTCLQPVKARKAAIGKLFAPKLAKLRAKALAAGKADEAASEKCQSLSAAVAARERDLLVMTDNRKPAQALAELEHRTSIGELHKLDAAWEAAEAARDRLAQDIAAERARKWDGQAALQAATARLADAEAARATVGEKLGRATGALETAEYWLEAFGDRGIRSLLVDSVAGFLNERMAHHLERLACGEASTVMSAQTALKKGGARESISFLTEWSWGVSGTEGSGGQDRRKDLAVFAAVQDLAESRSARPFPLKVWDEPGDALDARGKELFGQWVAAEARARGTGILITHSEELAAHVEPDHVWTVRLGPKGAFVDIGM